MGSATTELAVLSACYRDAAFGLAWTPDPSLFATPTHRAIAEACATLPPGSRDHAGILAVLQRNGDADVVGGDAGLFKLLTLAPLCDDPWPHVRQLEELRSLRSFSDALDTAQRRAIERRDLTGLVADVADALRRVACVNATEPDTEVAMLARAFEAVTTPAHHPWRVGTGIDPLDQDVGELGSGMVAVLGAPTSWGKSSMLLLLASVALDAGIRPLILSWEDPPELWDRRLLAMRSLLVPASALRAGLLSDGERAELETAAGRGRDVPFYADARGLSAERAAALIRAHCAADGVQLVLCDYLQKIATDRVIRDRRLEVTTVSRILSDAIKTAGAAGWLASQVRRHEDGRRPTMHDLKESGDVENAAEMVVMGYRAPNGVRLLTVDKAKDGIAGGTYAPRWDSTACCFRPGGVRVELETTHA